MIRVAIDGPAGVGKVDPRPRRWPSISNYAYLDTGAMYRACAWWCPESRTSIWTPKPWMSVSSPKAVGEFFTGDHFDISVDPDDNPRVFADGRGHLRGHSFLRSLQPCLQGVERHPGAATCSSPPSAPTSPAKRRLDSFSGGLGIVAEGRDITTVVSPDAEGARCC